MKKTVIAVFVLVVVSLIVGCGGLFGSRKQKEPGPGNAAVPPGPDEEVAEITLYFANDEYIRTGREDVEMLLTEKRPVVLRDQTLAEAAMEQLIKGPGEPGLSEVIPHRISLKGVETAEGIAYVNFSAKDLWGGSLEESLLISSTVMTLTELEGIKAVQFLVDGEKTESLMGHASVMDPIYRNEL